MQRTYTSTQFPNSNDLLRRIMVNNTVAASPESSDALVRRILDDAASKKPPVGLFDPTAAGSSETSSPPAFRAASPSGVQDIHASTPPGTSDALVQRILDDAVSKRPPIGLFDQRESDRLQATSSSDFHSAFPTPADPQFPSTRSEPDALVERILDEAASKRSLQATSSSDFRSAFPTPADPQFPSTRSGPDALVQRILDDQSPTELVDPRGYIPWPPHSSPPNTSRAGISPGVISLVPPIAPPPGYASIASTVEHLAPAMRASSFDFSPLDFQLAASALGRAAYQGIGKSLRDTFAPNQPSASTNHQSNPIPIPYGELTDFEIVKRIPGGGASDDDAYRHWYEGSGKPLRIEFSGANIEDDLRSRIAESSAGGLAGTFRNAINESLLKGQPTFVDTTASVDTGDIVRGRAVTKLTGWVTTNEGKWQFDGTATGKPEPFDFNSDPQRGFLTNAGTIFVGDRGHIRGAKDYKTTYSGAIQMRAGGPVRR